ncbi:MAG: DUF86 domain-containing protein [Phycisphaerae bacterium]
MSQRDDMVSLRHMLDQAREAVEMARGRTRTDLDTDRMFNLSMTRLLEIVGEAASRVSAEGREQISTIPWPKVVGLRNRLIHGYDEVDFDILWNTVRDDLPLLISVIENFLARTEPDTPSQ